MRIYPNWEQADVWMQEDPANRLIEGVEERFNYHQQNCWERVDKSKPFEFSFGHEGTNRWINIYPETRLPGLWELRGPHTEMSDLEQPARVRPIGQ